jgi:putative heme-binding domain-containing protein
MGDAVNQQRSGALELARQVAVMTGRQQERGDAAARLIKFIVDDSHPPAVPNDAAFAILAGLGQGLRSRRVSLASQYEGEPWDGKVRERLAAAAAAAGDRRRPAAERTIALELVACSDWSAARPQLLAALAPGEHAAVQRTSLRLIGSFDQLQVADDLIAQWRHLTPPLKDEAVGLLIGRRFWNAKLVAALEKGTIPAGQVSIPHRARLMSLADKALAERAKSALAAVALGSRKEVLDNYQSVLLLEGEEARGAVVYRRECASCHRLGGEGYEIGPNLSTIQHRSPQEILIHVLDPNREVSPSFLDYLVHLSDGRVLTGVIASETDAGLTVRRAENREDMVLRSEIEELVSSGKSLMPEGLEQKIPPQEMADLIAFLRQPR